MLWFCLHGLQQELSQRYVCTYGWFFDSGSWQAPSAVAWCLCSVLWLQSSRYGQRRIYLCIPGKYAQVPEHHLCLFCLPVLAFSGATWQAAGWTRQTTAVCYGEQPAKKPHRPRGAGAREAGPPLSPPAALPLYKAKQVSTSVRN